MTDEESEDRDEDNGDSPADNNVDEPQGNENNDGNTSGNGGSGQSQTQPKPSDNTPKPVETSAPKPSEVVTPKPVENSTPQPTEAPAPVSQCGEGCQYFEHMHCNDGYPAWYGATEKSNYIYAINQSLNYTNFDNATVWTSIYVASVSTWGTDRVMIGDPTDGEAYNNVWILTDPEEDIWTLAR